MKKLLGIVVLSLIFCGNVYSDIIDFKCLVTEQKIGDGNCTNCGKDDGLRIDFKKNKILVTPGFEDIEGWDDLFIIKNSSKYFDWTQPEMGRKFRFNKFTYELDYRHYVTGMNLKTGEVKYPRAWVFKVLYKCEKI